MILYLDASALVKRYVAETGSAGVNALISAASVVGTASISRAEVSSAFAKTVRMRLLSRKEAASALQVFKEEWESLIRLQLTEVLISSAAALAWDHGLRGYDAVHLAAALFWQDVLGGNVIRVQNSKERITLGRSEGIDQPFIPGWSIGWIVRKFRLEFGLIGEDKSTISMGVVEFMIADSRIDRDAGVRQGLHDVLPGLKGIERSLRVFIVTAINHVAAEDYKGWSGR